MERKSLICCLIWGLFWKVYLMIHISKYPCCPNNDGPRSCATISREIKMPQEFLSLCGAGTHGQKSFVFVLLNASKILTIDIITNYVKIPRTLSYVWSHLVRFVSGPALKSFWCLFWLGNQTLTVTFSICSGFVLAQSTHSLYSCSHAVLC